MDYTKLSVTIPMSFNDYINNTSDLFKETVHPNTKLCFWDFISRMPMRKDFCMSHDQSHHSKLNIRYLKWDMRFEAEIMIIIEQ